MFRRSASCSLRGSSWIFLPSAIGSLMFRPTRLKLLWELPRRYQCGGIAVSDDGTDNLSGREDRRREGRGRRAAPFGYSLSGFKLFSNQERPINSHFLEQNVCPSRARLVLLSYWE